MADNKDRPSVEIVAVTQEMKAKISESATKKGSLKAEEKDDDLRADLKMDEHKIPLDELLKRYETDVERGLTHDAVLKKQMEEGFNELKPPYEKPEWLKLLETQTGFFNLLLWFGAVLCFIGYGLNETKDNLYLGIVLSFVVTVTGIFEYLQEKKSNDLMNSFKNMLPPKVWVKREGVYSEIPCRDLCRGDIVKVSSGNKIPADMRLIKCPGMKVQQAALTGEPDDLKRTTHCTDDNPLETKNLCFFGTECRAGINCEGVVVNIGDYTVMGRIKTIATQTGHVQTPINREIERFVKIVTAVAVFLGVTFFTIGAIKETDFITNLVFMIGIIVANVPEGLLATVTVCLSLTAKRMFYKNVLVKNLESVETLGSTSCICSDKTGTLTINNMTVANVCYDQKIFETEFCRTVKETHPQLEATHDSAKRLVRCGTICNNATFVESSKNLPFRSKIVKGGVDDSVINWKTNGDASESAMIKFTEPFHTFNSESKSGIYAARQEYPKITVVEKSEEDGKKIEETKSWEIPFNSKNKYQVSVHQQPTSNKAILLMKGAPEKILDRCSHVWQDGERIEITNEIRANYIQLNLDLAKMGRRVLAFCEEELDELKYPADWHGFKTDPPNFPLGEKEPVDGEKPLVYPQVCEKLTYIGMMALIDPPRKQVPPAVAKCKSAGIKVVMVTGDHPATAHAIAKEVKIIWGNTKEEQEEENKEKYGRSEGTTESEDPNNAPAVVIPGSTFTHKTEDEWWDEMCGKQQIVFARTSPQQKLIIVENFQKRGYVVAVTGDGVNDAPALKKADIGVAMGIMGSEVSKDAADMILLDDNFSSIVSGVEEGRLIFDNLKKSIAYTLSSNIPEISPFLAFITINIPLPLSTILILCIDLGTDMVPAISMAWENAEADIMKRRPRNAQTDHLVTMRLVCFAYLQIGIVQACAGFYAWMTVLGDYGYVSETLPGLGSFDNWGKQILYCDLTNGVLRTENGTAYETPYQDMSNQMKNTALSDGFMFWDDDITDFTDSGKQLSGKFQYGSVKACHFAGKNFVGENVDKNEDKNKWYDTDVLTNGDATKTGGQRIATSSSILGLRKKGYIPYLPFRGRMSPFYRTAWLEWDITEGEKMIKTKTSNLLEDVYGLGPKASIEIHFQSQPVGFYTITKKTRKWDDSWVAQFTESAFGASKNWEVAGRKDDHPRAVYKDGSKFLPNLKKGKFSLFSKSEDNVTETNTAREDYILVNKLHSWQDGDKIYQNVASRQMQREALAHAQCAGFICIIVVQWADLMICKTRWLSIKQQGMVNGVMNFGLLFETCLGAFLCYTPGLGNVLGTRPLRLLHWTPGMPFCLFIFMYDEIRKKLMRDTSPEITDKVSGEVFRKAGWLERMTYY